MAQFRSLAIILRYDEIISDLQEADKNTSRLLKDSAQLRKKFLGGKANSEATKNKINIEDIESILLECQKLDTQNLKIQHLLHRCNDLSYWVQRQLELRTYSYSQPHIKGMKVGENTYIG